MIEYCPHKSNVPKMGRDENNKPKIVYEKESHLVRGDGIIVCTQCHTRWCCYECCIEDDSMDLKTAHKIYDDESVPKSWDIICCKCSGNLPAHLDDPDD